MSKEYPDDLNADLVRPAVQGVVYPLLAHHSVREIFSSQRAQIQQEIADQLARSSRSWDCCCAAWTWARWICRRTIARGWRSCSPRSSRPRRFATRWSSRRRRSRRPARGRGRQGTAAEGGRGGRRGAGHRRARAGGDHEAHPALQAEADRAASARGRGREGRAHSHRRGRGGGAPHRGQRRGGFAAEARRRRGVPAGARGQGQRGPDGARGRAARALPAADPEDPRRQALRQGPGHHRPDAGGGPVHRLEPHRLEPDQRPYAPGPAALPGSMPRSAASDPGRRGARHRGAGSYRAACGAARHAPPSWRRCGRATCSSFAASAPDISGSTTIGASAAATCAARRCGR